MRLAKLLLLFVIVTGGVSLTADNSQAFNGWHPGPPYYPSYYGSNYGWSYAYRPYVYGSYGTYNYNYSYRYGGGCCCNNGW